MWSPDRDLLSKMLEVLKENNSRNRCNTKEDLDLHVKTNNLIFDVEKHLRVMGVLR